MSVNHSPAKVIRAFSVALLLSACRGEAGDELAAESPAESPSAEVELVLTIVGDPNPLNGPTDLDVDGDGNIYVVDSENDRVQVFDASGKFVGSWGGFGEQFGQFNFTGGDVYHLGSLTVSPLGNLVVADTMNRRIQRFGLDGQFITAWEAINPEGTQFFAGLFGVASDRQGNVYAIDALRHEIVRFNPEGELLGRWGKRGAEVGQFQEPSYIFVNANDVLYLADWGNNRIQEFSTDGVFLSQWGSPGTADGEFNGPNDVAVGPDGLIYVADSGNNRIQVFDADRQFLFAWGSTGSGEYEFNDPSAVVVDEAGRIYVADYVNDRVQVFVRR